MKRKKFLLEETQMPTAWYNMVADMPHRPQPYLDPKAHTPITEQTLSVMIAEELARQELSTERFIEIPEEVQAMYRIWRPVPLVRATGLERALDTPAHIYFKNEGVSPVGSHKPNSAVPQAYYNFKQGVK
ncbi:MAG: TrpB-like pyridoxal-phosphate dependent enzyme, partial [Alistipes sp.]|nr:TrpB-like pyridoxal-phosphate dependent enzyme [Alistipes sp.]